MLSNLQPQQHRVAPLIIPDTPPGLVSPSSSTYSSIPSEGPSTWRTRSNGPLSPPMSSYDRLPLSTQSEDMSTKGSDDGQARRSPLSQQAGSAGVASRQQLPSLSSLFPLNMRTLPSPRSERPVSYPATSPLDPPRSADGYSDRSGSTSSYFPTSASSLSSTTQQHPRTIYETKLFDHGVPQIRTAFPGPLSPSLREPSQHYRADPPSSRWSYHHDTSRSSEYSFGGREQPNRYQPQQVAGQKHPHEEYLSSSRDYHPDLRIHQRPPTQQRPVSHPHQQYPSPITGETIPTKDGLGPKIWTGTHFLPRFVRAAEVPGEGMCYFYDDGSHCKTTIDGEVVNAHWGVTKAGKPRKRLAIACITCREKKIKCDPDYPRCVQCEKFGRVCKFKNAPRGGGHHNTSPTSESEDQVEPTQRRAQPFEYPQRAGHSPSVSPRTSVPSLMLATPPKRLKYEPDNATIAAREHNQRAPWQQQQQSQGLGGQLPLPRLHDDIFRQQRWRADPYASDPRHQEISRRTDETRV